VFTNFPPQGVTNAFFPEAEVMNRVNLRMRDKKKPVFARRRIVACGRCG
jgi:hypothetical protein